MNAAQYFTWLLLTGKCCSQAGLHHFEPMAGPGPQICVAEGEQCVTVRLRPPMNPMSSLRGSS